MTTDLGSKKPKANPSGHELVPAYDPDGGVPADRYAALSLAGMSDYTLRQAGICTPEMFDPRAGTGQDDTAALIAAIESSYPNVLLGNKTYITRRTLARTNGKSIIGSGAKSVIKAGAAIPMLRVDDDGSEGVLHGNRYFVFEGFVLDGDMQATEGMYEGLAVEATFRRIIIRNINGAAHVVDGAQNVLHEQIVTERSKYGLYLVNGAGNCVFNRCSYQGDTRNIFIGKDPAYRQSRQKHFGDGRPNQITFVQNIAEYGRSATTVEIKEGNNIRIFGGVIAGDGGPGPSLMLGRESSLCVIDGVYFTPAASKGRSCAIAQYGYRNILHSNNIFEAYPNGAEVIQLHRKTIFIGGLPHLSNETYRISNKADDVAVNFNSGAVSYIGAYRGKKYTEEPQVGPGSLVYNSDGQIFFHGKAEAKELQPGSRRSTWIAAPTTSSYHEFEYQLEAGCWLVDVAARTGDHHHKIGAIFIARFDDRRKEMPLFSVQKFGVNDLSSGNTVMKDILVKINRSGLLILRCELFQREKVYVSITATQAAGIL